MTAHSFVHLFRIRVTLLILILACCTAYVQQAFAFTYLPTPPHLELALVDSQYVKLPLKSSFFKSINLSKVGITITQTAKDLFSVHIKDIGKEINWDSLEYKKLQSVGSAIYSSASKKIPYFGEEINDDTKQIDILYSVFADSLNEQMGNYRCSFKGNADSCVLVDGIINSVRLFHIHTPQQQTRYRAKIYTTWLVREDEDAQTDSIRTAGYSDIFTNSHEALSNGVLSSFSALISHERFMRYLLVDTTTKVTDTFNISIPKVERSVTSFDEALQANVSIKRQDGRIGTGFAITNNGYLLTTSSLVFNQKKNKVHPFTIILPSGEEISARVIRVDTASKLALLFCDKSFLYAYAIPNAKNYKSLEEVYAIGTPGTLELTHTINLGIISNERKLNGKERIQLNININPGTEGGPITNQIGKLSGIVTSKLIGPNAEGVSFAVPAYLIPQYLHILIAP